MFKFSNNIRVHLAFDRIRYMPPRGFAARFRTQPALCRGGQTSLRGAPTGS